MKILLYHSIIDDPLDPYAVTIANFKSQMDYIVKNNYDVVSLSEALDCFDGKKAPRRSIAITFDDGFIDFFENALPVIEGYKFKSAVFIVTSKVGHVSEWRRRDLNRRLMGWEELRTITGMGHAIGSHGLCHHDLTNLTREELDKETAVSKDIIEQNLGIRVTGFSYPWGKCSEREVDSVKRAGYKYAVIVSRKRHNDPEADRFLLERIPVEHADSLSVFAKKIR